MRPPELGMWGSFVVHLRPFFEVTPELSRRLTLTALDRASGGVLGVTPAAGSDSRAVGLEQETSSGNQRRPDCSRAAPRTAAPRGAPPKPRLQPGDGEGVDSASGFHWVAGGPGPPTPAAKPRIGLPGAPPGSGAPIGCRRSTLGAAAEADRRIGGPAAASPPWRRPCSPPRPGLPLGSPRLSPLFALQLPPRSACALAPPAPDLPLRCGKACPASPTQLSAAAPLPRPDRPEPRWGPEPGSRVGARPAEGRASRAERAEVTCVRCPRARESGHRRGSRSPGTRCGTSARKSGESLAGVTKSSGCHLCLPRGQILLGATGSFCQSTSSRYVFFWSVPHCLLSCLVCTAGLVRRMSHRCV